MPERNTSQNIAERSLGDGRMIRNCDLMLARFCLLAKPHMAALLVHLFRSRNRRAPESVRDH